MMNRFKRIFIIAFLSSFASMASASAIDEKSYKCIEIWRGHLQEWVQINGPINGDLSEVQNKIYKDKSTTFSKIARSVWAKQKYVSGYYSDHQISKMFEESSNKFVPPHCKAAMYVGVLFNQGSSPWLFTDHGVDEMKLEAPKKAGKNQEYFGNWILLHVLIKGDEAH